jgi:hypothetical protein
LVIVPIESTIGIDRDEIRRRRPTTAEREVISAMSFVERLWQRRHDARQTRAINRAMQAAPTPAMREEIRILAQRQPF